MEWIQMSKDEFITKMVTLGVKYKTGLFPNGAWKQEGSVLSAYAGGILVGQYDEATGKGWPQTAMSSCVNPSEVIYATTTRDILAAITRRMGHDALSLTADDLELARAGVLAELEHHLDIREYIDIGLDAWEIARKL